MKRLVAFAFIVAALIVGCSSDEEGSGPTGVSELISKPSAPTGPNTVESGSRAAYRTGGSISTVGHPIEYRFDFDAAADHEYSAWSSTDTASTVLTGGGTRVVKAQARCAIHKDQVSGWSDDLVVHVNLVPATEIFKIVSTYKANDVLFTREIDFTDGVADTVPLHSWVTVFYRGADSSWDPTRCPDDVNKCFEYQMNYFRESARHPGFEFQSPWRPDDPVDTNPHGTVDSMSMNIGSMEYTISARSLDVAVPPARPDPNPPSIEIVGNFDPTLDGFSIENYDGTVINDGDTVFWEWWDPADSGLVTIPDVKRTKTFYFVVKATGHDHPWEPEGSAVKSWLYHFPRADDPNLDQNFGRSGIWVDGETGNVLSDTASFVAEYDLADINGDEIFVNNPPVWNDKSYDFTVMGRDVGNSEDFEQYMYFGGGKQLSNEYNTAQFGRYTAEGGFRFHVILRR